MQPKRLEASEIEVRLGSMWIPLEVYEQFMIETFQPPKYIAANHTIKIQYSSYTGNGIFKEKYRWEHFSDQYLWDEESQCIPFTGKFLNLKNIQIFDTYTDSEGKEHRELNKKETILAGQKQDMIKENLRTGYSKTGNGGKCWSRSIMKDSTPSVQDSMTEAIWNFPE